jgi:hypothetical protein
MILSNGNFNLNDFWTWLIATWIWFWGPFTRYIVSLFGSIFSANLPPIINIVVISFAFIILLYVWLSMLGIFLTLWALLLIGSTILWLIAFLLNQIFGFGWITTSLFTPLSFIFNTNF